ncbi:MAG: hypothetical protein FJ029_09660 [Actinobacteria bacterium]|nr:hypothetical protein [Actinomycetota bacterium]
MDAPEIRRAVIAHAVQTVTPPAAVLESDAPAEGVAPRANGGTRYG